MDRIRIFLNETLYKYKPRFLQSRLFLYLYFKLRPLLWRNQCLITRKSDFVSPSSPEAKNCEEKILSFIQKQNKDREIYIQRNSVPYQTEKGQRSVRFAEELNLKGHAVIFVRCFKFFLANDIIEHNEQLIEVPFFTFYPVFQKIVANSLLKNYKIALWHHVVIEQSVEITKIAQAKGWEVLYDVIDDWEEFHKDGFLPQYKLKDEKELVKQADFVAAINQALADKFKQENEKIRVVPNGFSERNLKKNSYTDTIKPGNDKQNLTIGSYGYLHIFRYNWLMINRIAKKNPDWHFEFLGDNAPYFLKTPKNVRIIEHQPPEKLFSFVRNWDVAIIPYHNNELCRKLNPIKIFELLYFGIPVVVTGSSDIKDYPYTFYANTEKEFEELITKAATICPDEKIIAEFLHDATWESRLNQLQDIR